MSFYEWDIALIARMLMLLAMCLLVIWYGNRVTRNRYTGLPRPKSDSRSSIEQFRRIEP